MIVVMRHEFYSSNAHTPSNTALSPDAVGQWRPIGVVLAGVERYRTMAGADADRCGLVYIPMPPHHLVLLLADDASL